MNDATEAELRAEIERLTTDEKLSRVALDAICSEKPDSGVPAWTIKYRQKAQNTLEAMGWKSPSEVSDLRAKLASCEAGAAAMRACLKRQYDDGLRIPDAMIAEAFRSDAGKDFVPRAELEAATQDTEMLERAVHVNSDAYNETKAALDLAQAGAAALREALVSAQKLADSCEILDPHGWAIPWMPWTPAVFGHIARALATNAGRELLEELEKSRKRESDRIAERDEAAETANKLATELERKTKALAFARDWADHGFYCDARLVGPGHSCDCGYQTVDNDIRAALAGDKGDEKEKQG